MTGREYTNALRLLDLNQQTAARFLQISLRTSHSYANGTARIPRAVALLFTLMIKLKLKPENL